MSLKMRPRNQNYTIFEYGSHNRQAISIAVTLKNISPHANITLFYRNDWYAFDPKSFPTKKVANEYLMLATQIYHTILGRTVVISTPPEACRSHVKTLFSVISLITAFRSSKIIFIRDIRPTRGLPILRFLTRYTSDLIVLENKSVRKACVSRGFRVDAIHPPNTYHDRLSSKESQVVERVINVVFLGSLDTDRRNYEIPIRAFESLRREGHEFQMRIGGQCRINQHSEPVFQRLHFIDATLKASDSLLDSELDQLLQGADILICCNRPEFYGSLKPSGSVGDIILSGRICFAPLELKPSFEYDEGLFDYYVDEADLKKKIFSVIEARQSKVIPEVIAESYLTDFQDRILANY